MKNKILICVGTSGLSAGANEVADNFQSELKNIIYLITMKLLRPEIRDCLLM